MTTATSTIKSESLSSARLRWPGASTAQLQFMRRVYEARVARSQIRGRFSADVPESGLEEIESGHKMRKEAAPFARQLLAEAREAIAASNLPVTIGITSAYRSASRQYALWQRYFPDYYNRTRQTRAALPGGEHGSRAVAHMVAFVGARIATPGYSNHNKGLAIDLKNIENGRVRRNSTKRRHTSAWRTSWLWNWLMANAQRFHFYQNTRIDEPWHWEFRVAANARFPVPSADKKTLIDWLRTIVPDIGLFPAMEEPFENISGAGLQWPGATWAQMQFMREVYNDRVRRSSARGTFVADVPSNQLSIVEGPYQLRTQAAIAARNLLQAARNTRDAASINVKIGLTSAYRSASHQFRLWQRYFPDYYRRTQAHRQTLPGGEHGTEALRYMSRFVGQRIGTPGYSNHNNGLAIDIRNEENNSLLRNRTNRAATTLWRTSWLWRWLADNAMNFKFYQNTNIDEPWHWEYKEQLVRNSENNEDVPVESVAMEAHTLVGPADLISDELDDEDYFSELATEAVTDMSQAIRANRRYGISLGWNVHHDRINDLLLPFSGQQNVSLSEDAFANALAQWQRSQGFSPGDSDGILGPNTWQRMQSVLGIGLAPTTVATVLPATAQAEWTNSPVIQSKYTNVQSYLAKRREVLAWGIPNPATYIAAAITEWNGSSNVHQYFRSFDGDPHRSYLNLKRLYNAKGIQNPAQYISTNIQRHRFFGRPSPRHVDLIQKLSLAEQRLRAAGHTFNFQSAYSFVPRTFNNNINKLSNHALGKAVDIDPQSNPHIRNRNEMKIIEAVCSAILVNGFLRERNPDVFQRASDHFKASFNSAWINRQTNPDILAILRSRSRVRKLEKYARLGFCTLPGTLVRGLQNAGLTWGGAWSSSKDFMHFETT